MSFLLELKTSVTELYILFESRGKRYVYYWLISLYNITLRVIVDSVKGEVIFLSRYLWDSQYRERLMMEDMGDSFFGAEYITSLKWRYWVVSLPLAYLMYHEVFLFIEFWLHYFFVILAGLLPVCFVKWYLTPEAFVLYHNKAVYVTMASFDNVHVSFELLFYLLPLLGAWMLYVQFSYIYESLFEYMLWERGWILFHIYLESQPLGLDGLPRTFEPVFRTTVIYILLYSSFYPYQVLWLLWFWIITIEVQLFLLAVTIPTDEEFITGYVEKDDFLQAYLDAVVEREMPYAVLRDRLFQVYIFPWVRALVYKYEKDPFKYIRYSLIWLERKVDNFYLILYGIFKYTLPRHHSNKKIKTLRARIDRWFIKRRYSWETLRDDDYAIFKKHMWHWLEFVLYRPLILDTRYSEMQRMDIEMVAECDYEMGLVEEEFGYDLSFSDGQLKIEWTSADAWGYKPENEIEPDQQQLDDSIGSLDETVTLLDYGYTVEDEEENEYIQSHLDWLLTSNDLDTEDFPYETVLRLYGYIFMPLFYFYTLFMTFVIYQWYYGISALELMVPQALIWTLIEYRAFETYQVIFDENYEFWDTFFYSDVDEFEDEPYDDPKELMLHDTYYTDDFWWLLEEIRYYILVVIYFLFWWKNYIYDCFIDYIGLYNSYITFVHTSVKTTTSWLFMFVSDIFLPTIKGLFVLFPLTMDELQIIFYMMADGCITYFDYVVLCICEPFLFYYFLFYILEFFYLSLIGSLGYFFPYFMVYYVDVGIIFILTYAFKSWKNAVKNFIINTNDRTSMILNIYSFFFDKEDLDNFY